MGTLTRYLQAEPVTRQFIASRLSALWVVAPTLRPLV